MSGETDISHQSHVPHPLSPAGTEAPQGLPQPGGAGFVVRWSSGGGSGPAQLLGGRWARTEIPRSAQGCARIHPHPAFPGMLAEQEEPLLRPPAQRSSALGASAQRSGRASAGHACSHGKWEWVPGEQRVPSAERSPARSRALAPALSEADNCLAVSDGQSRVSGQGGAGMAGRIMFQREVFF